MLPALTPGLLIFRHILESWTCGSFSLLFTVLPSLLEPCLAHSALFVLERKRLPFLQADVATRHTA